MCSHRLQSETSGAWGSGGARWLLLSQRACPAAAVAAKSLSAALSRLCVFSANAAAGPAPDILTGVAAAANRRRRGSAPATTTPRRPARGLQTGSSGGRSPAASERRPRQHRIRRATPSARAADAGVGLLAWRTRPTRRPETQPLAQSGEAVRRGGAERCRGTPLQRSAGRWRCLLHENAAVKNGRSTLLRCDLF